MTLFKDKYNTAVLVIYFLVLLSFYLFDLKDHGRVILYIVNFYLCFSLCIIFFLRNRTRTESTLTGIIVIALILRITLLFVTPVTSGDYYRYLWDGKVQIAGINPYMSAPEELTGIQDKIVYPNVTYPDLKTIYPPLAQIVFFLSSNISGTTAIGLKITYLLFETGIIIFLFGILRSSRVNVNYIFLYVLSPLIIFEFFINAHIDIGLLFFLSASIYFALKKHINLSLLFLGLSVMSKVYSLIFLPAYVLYFISLKFSFKKIITGLIFFLLSFTTVLIYHTHIYGMLMTFGNYLQNWYSNNLVYAAVNYAVRLSGSDNHQVTRIILIVCFAIFYFLILNSKLKFLQELYLIAVFYLFFSTTVHQWYIVILVLFLPVCFTYSALYWSFIIGATNLTIYYFLKDNVWEDVIPVLIVEYIVLAFLIFIDIKKFRSLKSNE